MVGEGGATHYREAIRLPFDLKELPEKEGKVLMFKCFNQANESLLGLWSVSGTVKPYEARLND